MKKMHPEDLIHKIKTFINELQEVQNVYFNTLVNDLKLNKDGDEFLFDYIYNCCDENFDDFEHYLQTFGKKYNDVSLNDQGENPALHMSSCEADIETNFPSAYNDREPISFGVDELYLTTK
jgi:hypothetical protein